MSYHLKIKNLLDDTYNVFPLGASGYSVSPTTEEQSKGADPLIPYVALVTPTGSQTTFRIPVTSSAEVLNNGVIIDYVYSPTQEMLNERVSLLQQREEERDELENSKASNSEGEMTLE